MDFSVREIHSLEDEFRTTADKLLELTRCKKLEEVTRDPLMSNKCTKDKLADIVLNLVGLVSKSRDVLRSAAGKLDEQKNDQISNQKQLLKLQEDLISSKKDQLGAVATTVKTEIRSFSDVVKKNCSGKTINPQKIAKAVRSANEQEDRSRTVIVFGVQEVQGGNSAEDPWFVNDMIAELEMNAVIERCERVGTERGDFRPLKVKITDAGAARQLLSKAKGLKSIEKYKNIYIAPDRTKEERIARKKLVDEMKKLIKNEPGKRYYIKNDQVCCEV